MSAVDVAGTARWSLARSQVGSERTWVVVCAVLVLVSTIGRGAMAPVIEWAIDDGVVAGEIDVVRVAALVLLALSAVTGLAAGLQTSLLARTGQRILHRVRVDAVSGLLRQPLGEFERRSRGDLVARVTSDVDKLGRVVSEAIPFAVGDVVALAAALFGLFLVSPVIALLSLLVIPPMAIAGRWLQRRAAVVYPAERAAAGAATGEFTESIEGLETIRTFGRQRQRQDRLRAVQSPRRGDDPGRDADAQPLLDRRHHVASDRHGDDHDRGCDTRRRRHDLGRRRIGRAARPGRRVRTPRQPAGVGRRDPVGGRRPRSRRRPRHPGDGRATAVGGTSSRRPPGGDRVRARVVLVRTGPRGAARRVVRGRRRRAGGTGRGDRRRQVDDRPPDRRTGRAGSWHRDGCR